VARFVQSCFQLQVVKN